MVWVGAPFAHRIDFSTGLPTGAVSYQLLGNDGVALLTQTLTLGVGAVSLLIIIAAAHNTCTKPLFETRTLVYSYTTADGLVTERVSYDVQRPLPFAASPEGVRLKLGVEKHELLDDDIELVSAYAEFVARFEAGTLVVHETAGDRTTILCIHAIEAFAGLMALPALQLKIAQRETSGTNEYQRFGNTDWTRIETSLLAHIARAQEAIDTTFDGTGGDTLTFLTVTRVDAVTGA